MCELVVESTGPEIIICLTVSATVFFTVFRDYSFHSFLEVTFLFYENANFYFKGSEGTFEVTLCGTLQVLGFRERKDFEK